MNALLAVKDHFTGFTKAAGFDPSRPDRLTDNQKHQIRRYYNMLTEYTEGGPVYKMKPSELPKQIKQGGKKNIDKVMKAAQMPEGRKRSKYIFVKYDGENIPRVSIKNNAPVFVNDAFGYAKEIIELHPYELARDPMGTVLSAKPLVQDAKFFRIVNGRHEFYNTTSLDLLGKKIIQLQNKYQTGNHAWDKWLHGIAAYYSEEKTAGDIINYERKSKEAFKMRVKKENARLRRKRK